MTYQISSPAVRQFARENNVDIDHLARELGRSQLVRADIENHLMHESGPRTNPPPKASRTAWDIDHSMFGPVQGNATSRFAQVTAENLGAAQTVIPAVTHHDCADIGAIENFRKSLRGDAIKRGVKLTSLAFHVVTLARLLAAFPRFNASLSTDGKTLWFKNYVHIGIAVDTPYGLMVPVIRDADKKGLWHLAREISDLATRAQARKIRPDEMGGASISISNLGGIGGRAFTPMVNPPEVAIVGLTRARMEPIWNGTEFIPTMMCPIDLSYDHRVINGADAARFVTRYAALLADPRRLIL
ncbi:2-oxo acid dehydrogenase subunit E2 [Thalassospira sp. MCCC 1A01428]|uniref:2-oxo acid dehydrogenase subunit E2 n=1 Tax=Thalassospira sp. MCCC 1A01428 TaxID=1470575 RepID=UPI000A1DB770|nr:2-oxo acid dehydrogenase subunit E2 [Thalassospira sp. MCCC 1A01428]